MDQGAPQPHARESIKAETVIAEVDSHWGAACTSCRCALIGHDVVLSMLMGQRDAPACIACLAAALRDGRSDFLRRAHATVQRLGCYRAGWMHSDRRLELEDVWPEDRIPRALRIEGDADDPEDLERVEQLAPDAAGLASTRAPAPAAIFDAGPMSCGDLVLELRQQMNRLLPGQILEVRATDAGAPEDLPAWCRVTRHDMLECNPPLFRIRRRSDASPSV